MHHLRICIVTLAVVASIGSSQAQAENPLFGVLMQGPSGFLGLSAPTANASPSWGQFIAQPITLKSSTAIGEVSIAVYGSGAYSYRAQLVQSIGAAATGTVPVADASYVFDYSPPIIDQYAGQWANLPVWQTLDAGTYYLVLSTVQPQIPLYSPPLVLGWGGHLGEVLPAGKSIADIGLPQIATGNPYFTPSFIDTNNPYASHFVSYGAVAPLSFLAYSGIASSNPPLPPVFGSPIPEPSTFSIFFVGLLTIRQYLLLRRNRQLSVVSKSEA